MKTVLVKYHTYESAHAMLNETKVENSMIVKVQEYTDIKNKIPNNAVIDDVKTLEG